MIKYGETNDTIFWIYNNTIYQENKLSGEWMKQTCHYNDDGKCTGYSWEKVDR